MNRRSKLPVAELHLHLEGTLEPEFIMATAAKNGVELPWASLEDLRARYEFTDLQSFLDLLYTNLEVLRTREDFEEMTRSYLRRAAAGGVRHAEVSIDLQAHTRRGIAIETVLDGIAAALDAAAVEDDLSSKLIVSFWRDGSVAEALEILTELIERGARVDGIGLDSAEVGYPPALFTEVYALARANGLHVVAHAGEEGPAAFVTEALDVLKVERIDHGIRSLEDETLIERLVAEQVPLTVCPLSNHRLKVVPTLDEHPILRMLGRGLLVSVNSDDPAYFGGYVDTNFDALVEHFGLDTETLARLARNSIVSSFAGDERRAELLAEVDAWAGANAE